VNLTLPGYADLFTLHVRQEVGALERLRSWLGHAGVATSISATQRNRYLTRIADHEQELLALLPADAASVDTTLWEALEPQREDAAKLRREVFALVQGVLFNEAELDGRLVEVARHLLAGLSRRSNLEDVVVPTVSPESESLNRTLELVRLRIPSQAVWELPICVHEFGHHVARALGAARSERSDRSPIEVYVEGETAFEAQLSDSNLEVARSRLQELFADAYATYAVGPAYPIACIVCRIPANRVTKASSSHPSWLRRVYLMAATLDAMSDTTGLERYRMVADRRVRPLWRQLAGGALPQEGMRPYLTEMARRIVTDLLGRHAADELLYAGGDQVMSIASMLAEGRASARLPSDTTVAHVLNAAWEWRLEHGDDMDRLGKTVNSHALGYCLRARS
jgi:hypothetical protein